jgi:hypothetical protein
MQSLWPTWWEPPQGGWEPSGSCYGPGGWRQVVVVIMLVGKIVYRILSPYSCYQAAG